MINSLNKKEKKDLHKKHFSFKHLLSKAKNVFNRKNVAKITAFATFALGVGLIIAPLPGTQIAGGILITLSSPIITTVTAEWLRKLSSKSKNTIPESKMPDKKNNSKQNIINLQDRLINLQTLTSSKASTVNEIDSLIHLCIALNNDIKKLPQKEKSKAKLNIKVDDLIENLKGKKIELNKNPDPLPKVHKSEEQPIPRPANKNLKKDQDLDKMLEDLKGRLSNLDSIIKNEKTYLSDKLIEMADNNLKFEDLKIQEVIKKIKALPDGHTQKTNLLVQADNLRKMFLGIKESFNKNKKVFRSKAKTVRIG